MVIARAPLRIEFLGGGTDIQYYYRHRTGHVLSAAINSFISVVAHQSKIPREFEQSDPRISAALRLFDGSNIQIASFSDITDKGSGLGSSSSFTVALIQAVSALSKPHANFSPLELAEKACHIEIDILGEPIGKQDQYMAAFGDIRHLVFHENGNVDADHIQLSSEAYQALSGHLLLFSTNIQRSASDILARQALNFKKNLPYLDTMADLVPLGIEALQGGDMHQFAAILEKEWQIKKNLDDAISNDRIEFLYQRAKKAGAFGGRISGAGGGGFLMLMAPPATHSSIRSSLGGLPELACEIESRGSTIIFPNTR